MKKVRNSVKARIASVTRRNSSGRIGSRRTNVEILLAQMQEMVSNRTQFRGVTVQGLVNFLNKLEQQEVASNIELYSFLEPYRVRDGVNAHLKRGTTALMKKEVGLNGKVQVYVPGVGDFVVDSKLLAFKERETWTVEDVGQFVFRYFDLETVAIPFSFSEEYMGKAFQGSFVSHLRNTNFHNLVLALLDHCRYRGKEPFECYVYLEQLELKLIPGIDVDSSRRKSSFKGSLSSNLRRLSGASIDRKTTNDQTTLLTAELIQAIDSFEESWVYMSSWEDNNMSTLKDLRCMCEIHTIAQAAETNPDFRFDIFCPTTEYQRFVGRMAEDFDTVVHQLFSVDIRKAKSAKTFLRSESQSAEAVASIVENHIAGGWEAMESRIFALIEKWLSRNVESMLAATKSGQVPTGLGGRVVPLPDLLSVRGRFLTQAGRYKAAEEHYREALDLGLDSELKIARTRNDLGVTLMYRGCYDEALEQLQDALMTRRAELGKESPVVAQSMVNVATVYAELGDCKDGQQLSFSAMKVAKQHAKKEKGGVSDLAMIVVGNALRTIGITLHIQGHFDEAVERFQQVVEIFSEKSGHSHPSVADCQNLIARSYLEMQNYKKAQTIAREALRIARSRDPHGEHPRLGQLTVTIGKIHHAFGETSQAQKSFNRALTMYKGSLDGDDGHPLMIEVQYCLGRILEDEGKFILAMEKYERALKSTKERLGETHIQCAILLMRIGELLCKEGPSKRALYSFEEAADIRGKKLGIENPLTAESLMRVADLHQKLGNPDKASEILKVCSRTFQASEDRLAEAHAAARSCSVCLSLRKYDDALSAGELSIRLFKIGLGTTKNVEVADVLYNMSEVLRCLGDLQLALKRADECIAIYRATISNTDPRYTLALRRSAVILKSMEDYKEAIRRLEEIVLIQSPIHSRESFLLELECLTEMAHIQHLQGNLEMAIHRLETARGIANNRRLPKENIVSQLGMLYEEVGEHDKALLAFQECVEEFGAIQAKPTKESILMRQRLGIGQAREGKFSKSKESFRTAVEEVEGLWNESPDEYSNLYMTVLESFAESLSFALRLRDQEDCLENLLYVKRKTYGTKSPRLGRCLLNLAENQLLQGNLDEVEQTLENVLGLNSEGNSSKFAHVSVLLVRAKVCEIRGRIQQAIDIVKDAHSYSERELGSSHFQTGKCLAVLGKMLSQLGEFEESVSTHLAAEKVLVEALLKSPETVENFIDKAFALELAGMLSEAEGTLVHIIAYIKQNFATDHHLSVRALVQLATIEAKQGNYTQSSMHIKEARAMCERADMDPQLLCRVLTAEGKLVVLSKGDLSIATALLSKAEDLAATLQPESRPEVIEARIEMASVEFLTGMLSVSLDRFRALESFADSTDRLSYSIRIRYGLGQGLRDQGDLNGAADQFQAAVSVIESAICKGDIAQDLKVEFVKVLFALWSCLESSEDDGGAQRVGSRALDVLDTLGEIVDDDPELAELRQKLNGVRHIMRNHRASSFVKPRSSIASVSSRVSAPRDPSDSFASVTSAGAPPIDSRRKSSVYRKSISEAKESKGLTGMMYQVFSNFSTSTLQ